MLDAYIYMDGLKVGDLVDTGGVNYGPYNAMTCLAMTDKRIAVHAKGNTQYWSQTRHYIPACVMVFEKVAEDGKRWACKNIFERECGRQSRQAKAEVKEIANALKAANGG